LVAKYRCVGQMHQMAHDIFTTLFKVLKLIATEILLRIYYQIVIAVFNLNVPGFGIYLFNIIALRNNRSEGGVEGVDTEIR
jgi:hypothetical protein